MFRKRSNSRGFHKTAKRVHRRNLPMLMSRGGIRL